MAKRMIRDKKDHCIMVTGSTQQRDVKLLSLCILNNVASKMKMDKYVREVVDQSTTMVGDYSTFLS